MVSAEHPAYGGDAVRQSAYAFGFGSLGSFGLLLCQPPPFSQGARQVWPTGKLVGSAGAFGQQLRTAEFGCPCGGGMLRGQHVSLVGEGLGRQLLGDRAKSPRFGECAVRVLAFGEQRFVVR